MNWDQIREIHESGIGTIGAHSFSHDYLISFDEASKSSTITQGYFPEGVLQ